MHEATLHTTYTGTAESKTQVQYGSWWTYTIYCTTCLYKTGIYNMCNIYKCTQIYVSVYIHTSLYTYIHLRADAVYQSQWGHGVVEGPTSQLTRKITFINWCHQACKIPEKIQIQLQIHVQIHMGHSEWKNWKKLTPLKSLNFWIYRHHWTG